MHEDDYRHPFSECGKSTMSDPLMSTGIETETGVCGIAEKIHDFGNILLNI